MANELKAIDAHQQARRGNQSLGHNSENVPLNDCLSQGMALLFRAYQYAKSVGRDVWDFAVEMDRLRDLGLGDCDFRLLAVLKFTDHAQEVTRVEDDGREFRPVGNLSFPPRTCFVLAPPGVARIQGDPRLLPDRPEGLIPEGPSECPPSPLTKPSWDPDLRKLMVLEKLVKHFKWPAINQERVLAAFEEEGWPARIDDPLPPQAKIDPKRRLHDTIKNLNKNQRSRLVHFRGDGTGEGVIWELYQGSTPSD